MAALIARRLLVLVPMLFLTTLLSFGLVYLIPGDPAVELAGEGATPEQIRLTAARLGLDRPLWEQYGHFIVRAAQGDLGESYSFQSPVTTLIAQRLPPTLSITAVAVVLVVAIGIPLGIVAGRFAGRIPDRVATTVATLGLATPNFVVAVLLVLFIAMRLQVLPATGYVPLSRGAWPWLSHLILPGLSLALVSGAEIARQLRGGLHDALGQDYIRTAVAKGTARPTITFKHALKNAMLPVVTLLGIQIAYLLGGTAVIENVFGIKGLGDLAVNAVLNRDVPAIQGIVLFTAVVTLLLSLVVDISYGWLNPRTRKA